MQKLLLANYSLKMNPLYGPFHRDMLNLSWLLESVRSSLRTGYFMLQKHDDLHFVPVLDGQPRNEMPDNFEVISFFSALENFVVHAFGLHGQHTLPLFSEKPLWVNLESINFNLREFFNKLLDFETTGFMVVENRVRLSKSHLLLLKGSIVWAKHEEKRAQEALNELLQQMTEDVCTVRVYEMSEEILSVLLLEPELAGVYESLDKVPFQSLPNTALLVSVSPEKYGYSVYLSGEEVFSEGLEPDAPFFELFASNQQITDINPLDVFTILEDKTRLKIVKYDPDLPILYFCPACWSVVDKDDKVCSSCGYDLTEFHSLPYEYKLIMALEHPVKDMKKNVIYTIGKKDLDMALPHLEVMTVKETDPIILMEIADALSRMSSPEATRLLRALAQHRYPVVRSRANMHLQRRLRG